MMKSKYNTLVIKKILNAKLLSVLAMGIILTLTASAATPQTPNNSWKLVFDASFDKPYKAKGTWNPKVWLYNQNNTLV
ncbi:MAG: hypothetical protein ACE5J3_11170, partial [Methanosarcinales archaeon]